MKREIVKSSWAEFLTELVKTSKIVYCGITPSRDTEVKDLENVMGLCKTIDGNRELLEIKSTKVVFENVSKRSSNSPILHKTNLDKRGKMFKMKVSENITFFIIKTDEVDITYYLEH